MALMMRELMVLACVSSYWLLFFSSDIYLVKRDRSGSLVLVIVHLRQL